MSRLFASLRRAVTQVKRLDLLFVIFAIFTYSQPALAADVSNALQRTHYEVFSRDINSDGRADLLIRAQPRIILIPFDDDLQIPVLVKPEASTFVLLSGAANGYQLQENPDTAILNAGWVPADYSLAYSAADGSLSITAKTTTLPSFTVMMSSSGSLVLTGYTPGGAGTPSPAPTISTTRTPVTMTAGQSYTLSWSSTNATSVSRVCTASGTGFAVSDAPPVGGTVTGTAEAAWVNSPSNCTWTASGPGGSATASEAMVTRALVTGDVVTYIHTDGLGSPVARTNAAGQVISQTRYEPYGLTASGATPTIGFTGHVNDADTGLIYMQQRYYDPVAGRFLSIDPVTTDVDTGGGFNRYAYAGNSPYKYVDPDGRDFCGSYQCEKYDSGNRAGGNSLDAVAASVKAGFNATIGAAVSEAADTSTKWLENAWDRYLDYQQAHSDLISAAAHGDSRAADQIGMEFAMGFVGSTSMKIAAGHAFEKHVLGVGALAEDGLFRGLGIRTVAQMEAHVAQVMSHPTVQKSLLRGRTAYFDARTSTVVIHNPRSKDLGTAFQPKDPIGYFNSLK